MIDTYVHSAAPYIGGGKCPGMQKTTETSGRGKHLGGTSGVKLECICTSVKIYHNLIVQ